MVKEVLTHPLFLTILFAGLGAQVLKMIIYGIKYRTLQFKDLLVTGGMPSSHSSSLVGLTTMIYLLDGATTGFFLSLMLTGVVVVDAMGVRRTAGEQGLLMHQLIKKTKLRLKEPHYAMGHTPAQVLVGSIYGFLVALIIFQQLGL